jgi:hypothetical protein
MSAEETLDEIDRIHDDDPDRAAAGLRVLDSSTLATDRLPLLAFLTLHVVGEKLGRWDEAADRLADLRAVRGDAPLAVVAHAAAAARLAGRVDDPAQRALATAAGDEAARLLTSLAALGWRPPADTSTAAAELKRLAEGSQSIDAGCLLNQRLAVGFNNTTSRLLDDLAPGPVDPIVSGALLAGSAAALRFWQAAGTWVHHERALYLCALVCNRLDRPADAEAACRRALDLIEAHGSEPVDRAFLQLQLAGALFRLGDSAAGQPYLDAARDAAALWDDAGLKSWFATEHGRLFGTGEPRP